MVPPGKINSHTEFTKFWFGTRWMARGRAFVYYAWGSEFHPQSCVLVQACTYTHTPSPALPTHPPHTHTQTGEKEREEESKGDGCSKGKKRKREKRSQVGKREEEQNMEEEEKKDEEELFQFAQPGGCQAKLPFLNFPPIKRE